MSIIKRAIRKINRETRYAYNDVKTLLAANESFFRNARGARIVCYHGICKQDHLKFNNIFLTEQTFHAHLEFYKKYFNVVSLEDYYNNNFNENKFNVCITFDDGYANNYKYVLPLLKKYKMPATFFVTGIRDAGYDILWNDFFSIVTKYGAKKILYKQKFFVKDSYGKYVDEKNIPLGELIRAGGFELKEEMMKEFEASAGFLQQKVEEDFWLQMTAEQINELSQSEYCTIGAHGYYHNDLAKIDLHAATEEMQRVKKYLESLIQKNVDAFAFPYGMYSREVADEAKKIDYSKLLAVQFHFKEDADDTQMRERLIVNPYISVANQMTAIINNKYW